ncbi:unnamed protein product (macronuclear) [Paramecium tetraurelia]|uniref:Translation initiation factor 5A C-terminal domain-containing protein n=1 Tax=Paramecium tetraurelia TaxID=5888 RepID=A0ECS4_PARTE|nr:uncharacterized protein GSPATT00003960001 [Paramecium tetraurelia]CAK93091.1 unnamed protein product [Paramecium tetraurelia]|eukprot:XP_001460488.1 hypothetical protein (macronuclear) [Paramecium tetraurelia strain d4-2]
MFYDLIPGKQAYLESVENLQQGTYLLLDECPCKILRLQLFFSRHGHCAYIEVENAFSKQIVKIQRSIHGKLEIPLIQFEEYSLIGIQNDDFLTLLNSKGTIREDIKMPQFKELANKLRMWFEEGKDIIVQIIKYMDKEEVSEARCEE